MLTQLSWPARGPSLAPLRRAPLHWLGLHDFRWDFGMGNRNRSGTRPLNRVGRDRGPTEAAGRGRLRLDSCNSGGPTLSLDQARNQLHRRGHLSWRPFSFREPVQPNTVIYSISRRRRASSLNVTRCVGGVLGPTTMPEIAVRFSRLSRLSDARCPRWRTGASHGRRTAGQPRAIWLGTVERHCGQIR